MQATESLGGEGIEATGIVATGTFAAPMSENVASARAEVHALAMHLEALMLTNRALLAQLAEAKQRAACVESQLDQDTELEQKQRRSGGRRGRDEVDSSDEENSPKYRSSGYNGPPALTILSSWDAPPDEFEHGMPDDSSVTYRSWADDHKPVGEDWDSSTSFEGSLQNGSQIHLSRLREVVRALGALAALGDGAEDNLGA
jgi:hypothetical protein